ncbi:hypothetical protein GOODEAATRI_006671, partial [Goodea atripinnis]
MLCRGLKTTLYCSSCESPFHSYLQSRSSEITSWKQLTIAHLAVHPPTPRAQLKPLKDHTENASTVNLRTTPPAKLSLCGEVLSPSTS